MNNIYKVIWSKAKNCYVVASEIARSHTKSASGSEKIGGDTRRKLLASLMALSLLCGGLGVAEASVHVNENTGGAYEVLTKQEVTDELNKKVSTEVADLKYAKASDVVTNTGNIATNTANITQLDTKKLDKDLANSTFATKDALNGLAATVNNKVDESVVETALDGKADKADTLAGYGIKDAYTKGDVDNKLNEKADAANVNTALAGKANVGDSYTKAEADGKFATSEALNTAKTDLEGKITSAKNELDGKITANTQKIGANETAITDLKDADVRLEGKINQNTNDITGLKDKDVELSGKIDNNKNLIDQNAANITQNKNDIAAIGGRLTTAEGNIQTNADAINALDTKVGTINNGNYLDGTKSVGENLNALDAQTKTNTDEIARVNQELVNTNNHFNTELGKTNTALNKEVQERVDADTKLTGRIDATDKRTAGIKRTDTGVEEDNQTVIEGKVHFDQNGNVSDVKDLSAETITTTGDAAIGGALGVTGATTLDGALMANGEATFKDKVSVEKDLTVNGKLNVGEIYLEHKKLESTGKDYDTATSIKADGISNRAKVTDEHGNTTESKFTHNEKGTFNYAKDEKFTGEWKGATSNVTADGVENVAKDSKGNNNTFTQTSTDTKNILKDKDGNTSTTRQDSKGIYGYAKDKDGNKSYTKQEGNRIAESVIGQDGKQTKSEMTSTDITNTAKDGTIKNDAKDIVNNATGNMTNTVGGDLTTTVGGNELHEVTGKQTNTVGGGQENIISGGQINNITGDQTTTITGNKTETVTENVTEDYKKNLTTTVGGNEIHEVKGTKTETVEGKVTENFKGGQETNVTGDQTTNVSGTQTTNATDINRNASSGMIDKVDNDYGTNTETKVAGKTTTDVSIKGTGEKGQYIRGANESRDYLIKGTLKNSETKTAETTSTEITDGNGNISATIQDAKNLAGSVNNGTETGVSGIHANDDGSVSIDSIVTDGSTSSVINQKKDSIQSAVGDGNSSTVIRQDKDNVTIASSNGTVAIGGKDIINNAQDTITNTAGTKITDTAGDSTVTTENGKGTTFSKTGSTAYREGGPTDTNISGNTITTGKVTMDYAEVMKDLGVRGNANIAGKTTTGELEVTGKSTLKGDVTMESNATVKKDLTVEGTTTTKTLKVTENATVGGTLDVAKKATFQDAVDIAKDLSVGGNATIKGDVTAKSYKVGDKTYISADGINANDQKITNVADGSISEGSKDAVNGGQLYGMKRDLEHQVDKVGANAAAMANLHPMEFDPGSKWNIAAAMGNYGSETAAALGAFYRPNDDVMVNLSTAFGTGENMVGGGVSVRLGKGGNKLSREESNALKAQVADLTARMDALLSVLNPNMSKDFPDVPENHWAYEAVSRLAGNDIVQGYPDGEFHGERTMTRYEMAEIIYNALSRGAEAEKELVEEFKPELQAMVASEKATAEKAEG